MTFDEFKDKGSELEMDLGIEMLSRKTKSLGSSIDEHFISLLIFQMQLKVMHWGTESYAQHNAFGTTYETVDEGLDALVESYQGYHGRIEFGGSCDLASFKDVECDSWLSSMLECLNSLRGELNESDLQNMIDELIAAVSKLKYLLTLK
jgi:DNA-binding ferritin-like protein